MGTLPMQKGAETRASASGRPAVIEALAPEVFKQAFRGHPAGVAIITADNGQGPVGLTATSLFSVSAEPPIFAFSLSSNTPTSDAIASGDTVVAHLLCVDQLAAAQLFSTRGADRFADNSSWARLATGEPYLVGAPIWIRGRIVERLRMQVGHATVIACHALEAHVPSGEHAPLIFHGRAWHGIGEHSQLPD